MTCWINNARCAETLSSCFYPLFLYSLVRPIAIQRHLRAPQIYAYICTNGSRLPNDTFDSEGQTLAFVLFNTKIMAWQTTAASSACRKWSWQCREMEGTCIPLSDCNCIPPVSAGAQLSWLSRCWWPGWEEAGGRGVSGERVVVQIHVIELGGITLGSQCGEKLICMGKNEWEGKSAYVIVFGVFAYDAHVRIT